MDLATSCRRSGVSGTPCPRHGWAHSDRVVVGAWRRHRRHIRGLGDGFDLAGRDCCCLDCKVVHDAAVSSLKLARSTAAEAAASGDTDTIGRADANVEQMEKDLKAACYRFVTYNPNVREYFTERYPQLVKMDYYLTHRAGITQNLLFLNIRTMGTSQGPTDLAKLNKEIVAYKVSEENPLSIVCVVCVFVCACDGWKDGCNMLQIFVVRRSNIIY